jgi:CDP-diacylglycerol--glycerol-3-phosphate 3-phosphatidyltransferase
MLERLKAGYEWVLSPAVALFRVCRLRPNHLTVAGVLLFAAAGWYSALGRWYVAAAFIIAGALMDGCDGLLARRANLRSDFGAILDSSLDRITEILWLGGLTVYYVRHPEHGPYGAYLCLAAVTGSLMVSYVKARCEGQGVPCRGGLMQRPERIVLLLGCTLAGPTVTLYGLGVLAVLSYITMLHRLGIGYAACRSRARGGGQPGRGAAGGS